MTHPEMTLDEALNELVSAEDFLDYFAIAYDAEVVKANRLYILLRFHHYLRRQIPNLPPGASAQRAIYRLWFERAYEDFARSPTLAVFSPPEFHGYAANSMLVRDEVGAR